MGWRDRERHEGKERKIGERMDGERKEERDGAIQEAGMEGEREQWRGPGLGWLASSSLSAARKVESHIQDNMRIFGAA